MNPASLLVSDYALAVAVGAVASILAAEAPRARPPCQLCNCSRPAAPRTPDLDRTSQPDKPARLNDLAHLQN